MELERRHSNRLYLYVLVNRGDYMRMIKLIMMLYMGGLSLLIAGHDADMDFARITGAIIVMIGMVVSVLNILQII